MKKKEIINLIKASNTLNKYKKLSEISKDGKLSEDKWFPDIPELNSEFEILKKEVKKANKYVEKAKKSQSSKVLEYAQVINIEDPSKEIID